jgi:ABC-2 type transport system ATP-binding protein
VTIFISSHILSELEQIANTIGVLNKGKLLKEVSMDYIREETLDYIEFVVDDLKKASYVSNELLKINNFKVIGKSIRIYEKTISKSTILEQFVLNGVKIISMDDKRDSLEKYFLNLLDRSNVEDDKIN